MSWLRGSTRRMAGSAAALLALTVLACGPRGERGTSGGESAGGTEARGFDAVVTGAVQGKVSARGVVRYLPTDSSYFVADAQGSREIGVTLMLPGDAEPGAHPLTTAGPFASAEAYQARLDHTVGNRIVAFGRNVRGSLTLDSFPTDPAHLAGARVRGSFEFDADDGEGSSVSVTGSFDFVVRGRGDRR